MTPISRCPSRNQPRSGGPPSLAFNRDSGVGWNSAASPVPLSMVASPRNHHVFTIGERQNTRAGVFTNANRHIKRRRIRRIKRMCRDDLPSLHQIENRFLKGRRCLCLKNFGRVDLARFVDLKVYEYAALFGRERFCIWEAQLWKFARGFGGHWPRVGRSRNRCGASWLAGCAACYVC